MVQLRASVVVFFVACIAVRTAAAGPNPHYGQVVCTACHIDEEDYELRNDDPTALCNSCHDKDSRISDHHPLRPSVPGIDVPDDWPLYEGMLTCLTCHVPSHEDNIGRYMFLRGESDGGERFCFTCHRREMLVKRNPHQESNGGTGCGLCHAVTPKVGTDTLATVTFCGNPDTLCTRCHNTPPHPASFQHNRVLDEQSAAQLSKKQHLYRGNRIICSTCHNPHEAGSDMFMLRDSMNLNNCPGCHKK